MSDGAAPSASDTAAPTSQPSHRAAPTGWAVWRVPLLIGLIYLLFWQVASRTRTESEGAILFSTVLGLALIIWFNSQIARGFRSPGQFGLSLVLTATALLPLQVMVFLGRVFPPWSWLLAVKGLPDILFVWLAASFGGLLSYLLRSANMIPPIAAVLALVDLWTVFLGPVGKMLKSDSPTAVRVTSALTMRLPAPKPSGASPYPPIMVIGFADFLFIAFFVAAITRFVPAERVYNRMLVVLIAVLSAYMLLVHFSGLSLPALLPLAVVMLALHWRYFQYSRSEVFALLYAGLFIALIGAGFWYMSGHSFAGKAAPLP